MRLKITIVEDNFDDYEALNTHIQKWAALNFHVVEITHYSDPDVFLRVADELLDCDILILDIMLGESDGITVASHLQKRYPDMLFVLTSTDRNFAEVGYNVSAFGFLSKPVEPMMLSKTLDRALNRIDAITDKYFIFSSDGTTRKLLYRSILFIESAGNYIKIHTTSEDHMIRAKFSETLKRLPPFFVKSSRTIIVNIINVSAFTTTELTFDNGSKQKISRGMLSDIKTAFANQNTYI